VVNIANMAEREGDEVLSGVDGKEDRFIFHMRLISENSETFRVLQESIYTRYRSELSFASDTQSVLTLQIQDLQTDYTVKRISQTFSSALNLYLSKALKFTKYSRNDLANVTIPYIDYRFNESSKATPAS